MSEWMFQRDAIGEFRFVRCGFDADTGVAQLVYAFDDGPELIETVTVPGAPFELDAPRAHAVEQALRLLHLVAGVSYYKAAVPVRIRIDSYDIDADTATLLESIYLNGLGEFAYRNGLDLHGHIRFPHRDGADAAAPSVGLREHALVAIGGGKDSLVSIEALRTLGVEQIVTWIGGSQLIAACAGQTGLPTLNVGRALAPKLFDYNRQGAWNGHIPVTAVNSAILVLTALLHGVDQVVFSNERSASYGSMIVAEDGTTTKEVNHQWSKGWAFESTFGEYLQAHVAADLHYYSLLRPLSELAVARQFAKSGPLRRAFFQLQPQFPHPRRATSEPLVRSLSRSAISCSWRWRLSCRSRGWSASSAATCWTIRRRPRATMRCWNTRITSRSNAWARVANHAPRWLR